jgi:hypothetical protein
MGNNEFIDFQVLVHGEHNEMGRLKAAIIREYEDKVGHFECFYVRSIA